jgi:nucleoside phosphorylase
VAANLARTHRNVRAGLMVGIGGGAPSAANDIRLGDVVVNESGVFQYDLGKKHQDSPYEYKRAPNSPPAALLTALAGLQSRYRRRGHKLQKQIDDALERNPRLKKEYGKPESSTDILFKSDAIHSDCRDGSCDLTAADAKTLVQRRPRNEDDGDMLQIHYGLIATGNSVVKDASFRDKLADEHGVLCFEMEAGGLVDSLPCLVIRGICDYSDSHKNKQWQGHAAMSAAAYAKDVLMEVNPSRVQSGIRLSEILRDSQS